MDCICQVPLLSLTCVERAFVLPMVEDVLEESLFSSEEKVLVHLSFLSIAFSYESFP